MRHEVNRRRAATYLLTIVTATIWLVGIFLSAEALAQQALGTIIQSAKTQDKKETPTSIRKPHRLIRKSQSLSTASVVPLQQPTTAGPSSLATPPVTLEPDITTSSKETSSANKNTGLLSSIAAPLSTVHIAPSATTTTGSISAGSAPTGTIPLAAAGKGNSSTSGNGGGGGRSMNRLAAEMPGLAQLLSPPSAPVVSGAVVLLPPGSFRLQIAANLVYHFWIGPVHLAYVFLDNFAIANHVGLGELERAVV